MAGGSSSAPPPKRQAGEPEIISITVKFTYSAPVTFEGVEDDEGEEEEVEGVPDSYEKDNEGIQHLSASMWGPGKVLVCEASMIFVERGANVAFHANCDNESSDLQETGCLLFGGRGEPRHPQVKALQLSAEGLLPDFLYIDDLAVAAGQEEAAPHALRAMLLELQEQRGWALVAFYVCAPRSEASCRDRRHAKLLEVNRLAAVRAGLVQVGDGPVYIASPQQAAAPVLLLAQALAVAEQQPPEPKAKSAEDEELFNLVMDSTQEYDKKDVLCDKDLDRVKALLAKGATLQGSHALHVCAARGAMACLFSLLVLLPHGPGQLAAVNACVLHPLSIAAQARQVKGRSYPCTHAHTVPTHAH